MAGKCHEREHPLAPPSTLAKALVCPAVPLRLVLTAAQRKSRSCPHIVINVVLIWIIVSDSFFEKRNLICFWALLISTVWNC